MKRVNLWIMVVALATSACGPRANGPAQPRGNRDVVTQEQLAGTNSTDLFGALEKLKPEWLTSRGPTSVTDAALTQPNVFMDGQIVGNVEFLRQIRVLNVTGVRCWGAGPAAARFGMGHPRGVIEILRR